MNDPESTAAAAVLRQAMRRRQAERAVRRAVREDAGIADLPPSFEQLLDALELEEPKLTSHRPLVGPLITGFKRLGFHLFAKWYLRSVLEHQERVNRAVFAALRDLAHELRSRRTAPQTAPPAAEIEDQASDGGPSEDEPR